MLRSSTFVVFTNWVGKMKASSHSDSVFHFLLSSSTSKFLNRDHVSDSIGSSFGLFEVLIFVALKIEQLLSVRNGTTTDLLKTFSIDSIILKSILVDGFTCA